MNIILSIILIRRFAHIRRCWCFHQQHIFSVHIKGFFGDNTNKGEIYTGADTKNADDNVFCQHVYILPIEYNSLDLSHYYTDYRRILKLVFSYKNRFSLQLSKRTTGKT